MSDKRAQTPSPFAASTALGRQRQAEVERTMREHASHWDGTAVAGKIVLAAARELIVETALGSLVLFDAARDLGGARVPVGTLIDVAADGSYRLGEPERDRGR